MEALSHIFIGVLGFIFGVFANSIVTTISEIQSKSESIPKRNCNDCNRSKAWCFYKKKYKQIICSHPEHAIKMRTIDVCVTCEKVEHYCSECGKVICSITDCT